MNIKTKALVTVGMLLALWINSVAQPISTVQFSSARYSVSENGGTVTLTVERIGEPGGTAYVEYATRNGTATNGTDYVEGRGCLQFFGETNLTIVVPILNDTVAERDETFSVALFNPDPFDTELGTFTNAIVTILDNDRGVEFSSDVFTVDEAAGGAVVTVRAGTESTNGFSVDYFTSGCGATPWEDYVPKSGTLNFAPGETEKTILILTLDDALVEGDEKVNLSLTNPVGISLGARSNALLVVHDNDTFDITLDPQRQGLWSAMLDPRFVTLSGNRAFVADGLFGLCIFDVSDGTNPQPIGRAVTINPAVGVAVSCHYAFVAESFGMEIFDVARPSEPQRVGTYYSAAGLVTAMAVDGSRAYLARDFAFIDGWHDGLDVIDIGDPANPRLLAALDINGFWGVPDVAAASGRFVCIANGDRGMAVVDVSEPTNPQILGEVVDWLFTPRVAASGHHAYRIAADGILEVFDLLNPSLHRVGAYDLSAAAWSARVLAGSHLKVVGGYAYVTSSYGLDVINVRDPSHPCHAAGYATSGGPLAVNGDEAVVATNTGLETVDLNPLGFRPGSIATRAGGQVQFTLNTRPGQSYTVQTSTNLMDWEGLETRTARDYKLIFTDTNAPSFGRRFYRAVLP